MIKKDSRPPLGGLIDDDTSRIREYGLRRGFIPTETPEMAPPPPPPPPAPLLAPAPAQQPPPSAAVPVAAAPAFVTAAPAHPRPAATKPWQAMFPDYLIEELRLAAAREGTAQKVVVMRALRQAGFRVDDLDLQDLRRR